MKLKFSLITFLFIALSSLAQVTNQGNPVSWDLNLSSDGVAVKNLPEFDMDQVKAEDEIKTLQSGAADKINKIAIDTSSELIQKLIGAEVNNSSISAIVDDLSKRSGDKYYGN